MFILKYLFSPNAATGLIIFGIIIAVILGVVQLAGWCAIYLKMGLPGWKAVIPFYGNYLLFKKIWKTEPFWIKLAATLIVLVLELLSYFLGWKSWMVMYIILILAISTVNFVINIKLMYSLSNAFNLGIGYTLGLIFFQFLFVLLIGYGKTEYVGINEKNETPAQ